MARKKTKKEPRTTTLLGAGAALSPGARAKKPNKKKRANEPGAATSVMKQSAVRERGAKELSPSRRLHEIEDRARTGSPRTARA